MKISKLFHWLYAILMLLPFAFFVPSVLYYAFNDNATMQSVEVPKTETIAVDFNQISNVQTSNIYDKLNSYSFEYNDTTLNWNPLVFINDLNVTHIYYLNCLDSNGVDQGASSYQFYCNVPNNYYLGKTIKQKLFTGISNFVLQTGFYGGENHTGTFYINFYDLTQMFGVGNEPTIEQFNTYFHNQYFEYTQSSLMQITYDTGETEQFVENTSIISYAWESIWDLPLFSWTKVTFVSVPFAFITGIFGVASSSSLNYVFGYFATISIVWLLFDVILFLPMLAHRWIDKARIE